MGVRNKQLQSLDMKNLTKILAICLVFLQNEALGAKHYWWMDDPTVFGDGPSSNLIQKPAKANQAQQPPEQKYQNPPAVQPVQQPSGIRTECPSGTKCVAEFFCNENAIMVNQRVSLTPAQKRQRGSLTSCVLGGDLGVCCSTAQSNGGSSASNLPVRSQQQTVASEPVASAADPDSDAEVIIPTGSCPEMAELPPIEACQGKNSTCWSVGLPDVDCVDNALCCFDGCVNACFNSNMDTPAEDPPALTTPAPILPRKAELTTPPSKPPQEQETIPPEQVAQASNEVEQKVPAPEPTTKPTKRPSNVVNEVLQPAPRAQGGGMREASEEKPHVMCPAAMLCVPREKCDFKGFITEQTLSLSPQLEMLRVPLINCVNMENQNIDVCCRDPNYVDPWPQGMMMNGGGNMMNGGGKQMNQPMTQPAPAPAPAPQPAPAENAGIIPRTANVASQQQKRRRRKGGYGRK